MKGPIQRFKSYLGLNTKKGKRGPKGKKPSYHSRDYRGTRGAIKDIEEGKR